ncbi:MAG: alpha/beta fold hydrolase, partial [Dehalococcoidia bacterium]
MRFVYRNKIIRYAGLSVIVVVLLVLVGGGWFFSSVLEEDGLRVDHSEPENRVVVVAIGIDTITLEQMLDADEEENLAVSATWGLTDGVNYGQLGEVLSESDGQVTRELKLLKGGFQVGDELYFNRAAFPHDPFSAQGLPFDEVMIPGELGEMGAWYVPHVANVDYQDEFSDVWTIFVHGRTGHKDASLKMLGLFGANSLTIDYRNDEGAPSSESGYYDFGTTEWRDVEAAVEYALDNGARQIILVGFSMGGGIVVNYQLQSDLAVHTIGIVLDAPMLNFGRTIDKGAEERSVPSPITAFAKLFTTLRFG